MEMAAVWVTLVSSPLTVLALFIAGIQLFRTKAAAEAAEDAAKQSASRATELRLQALAEHLARLADLFRAISADDRGNAAPIVSLWDTSTAELLGTVRGTALDGAELRELVAESRRAGSLVTTALRSSSDAQSAVEQLSSRMTQIVLIAKEGASVDQTAPAGTSEVLHERR